MDGLFHGKSIYKWMMTGVTRLIQPWINKPLGRLIGRVSIRWNDYWSSTPKKKINHGLVSSGVDINRVTPVIIHL